MLVCLLSVKLSVAYLIEAAAANVFHKCTEGDNPLFGSEGWKGRPTGAMPKA